MEDMKRQVSHNAGLEDAVWRLMEAGWEKENIAPTGCEHDAWDSPAYQAYRLASDTYRTARSVEVDRLRSLVGWKADLSLYGEEEWELYIQEVPFGVEVVEEPTE
jgi:hypothetical protein